MNNSDEVKQDLNEFLSRVQMMTNVKQESGLFSSITSFFGSEDSSIVSLVVSILLFYSIHSIN